MGNCCRNCWRGKTYDDDNPMYVAYIPPDDSIEIKKDKFKGEEEKE